MNYIAGRHDNFLAAASIHGGLDGRIEGILKQKDNKSVSQFTREKGGGNGKRGRRVVRFL